MRKVRKSSESRNQKQAAATASARCDGGNMTGSATNDHAIQINAHKSTGYCVWVWVFFSTVCAAGCGEFLNSTYDRQSIKSYFSSLLVLWRWLNWIRFVQWVIAAGKMKSSFHTLQHMGNKHKVSQSFSKSVSCIRLVWSFGACAGTWFK